MDIIRYAIDRPIAVVALVIMAILFGIIALTRIPIQLAPDVRKPIVVVETEWPGAAPSEIEREIVNPQEEALRGCDARRPLRAAPLSARRRTRSRRSKSRCLNGTIPRRPRRRAL